MREQNEKNKKWILYAGISVAVVVTIAVAIMIAVLVKNHAEKDEYEEPDYSSDITTEDVNDAIYGVLEDENKDKYSNSTYRECAVEVKNYKEQVIDIVKVGVPKKLIDGEVASITNGEKVVVPIKGGASTAMLTVNFLEYNEEQEYTASKIIASRYNGVVYDRDYQIVATPVEANGFARFIYDDKRDNAKTRESYKAINCGDVVAVIHLQSVMTWDKDWIYEVLDSVELRTGITAEEMNEINMSNDEKGKFVEFKNEAFIKAVQESLKSDVNTIFSKSELERVTELELQIQSGKSMDVSDLKYFTNLESLYIDVWVRKNENEATYQAIMTDFLIGWDSMSSLTNLTKLEVRTQLSAEGLGKIYMDTHFLKNLVQLEKVEFKFSNSKNSSVLIKDLEDFSELTNLKELRIYSEEWYDDGSVGGGRRNSITDISVISKLSSLRVLDISADVHDTLILKEHPTLKEVSVNGKTIK